MKEFNFIEKQINEKLLQKKQLKSQSNQIFNKMSSSNQHKIIAIKKAFIKLFIPQTKTISIESNWNENKNEINTKPKFNLTISKSKVILTIILKPGHEKTYSYFLNSGKLEVNKNTEPQQEINQFLKQSSQILTWVSQKKTKNTFTFYE